MDAPAPPKGADRRRARGLLPLGAALLLAACAPAGPMGPRGTPGDPLLTGPEVRVRVFHRSTFTRIGIELGSPDLIVRDGEDHVLTPPPEARKLYVAKFGDSLGVDYGTWPKHVAADERRRLLRLTFSDQGVGIFKFHLPGLGLRRQYEGNSITLEVIRGRLAVVNQLPLEMYLARVLPSEMDPSHFTAEALKAQAVVARTWALKNLNRHIRWGYNFCDSTHCQVYHGRRLISPRAERAVRQTLGEVLAIDGRMVPAFYHSTCGGNTVYVHEVWGGPPQPHLSRVEDRWQSGYRPYCARSPFAQWRVRLPLQRLGRVLQEEGVLGRRESLKDVRVDAVNRSGRVERVLLVTNRNWHSVDVRLLRRLAARVLHGRHRILSRFFELNKQREQVIVEGKGLGHGVGMCQWGARGMAQHGFGYVEILRHYFQGTSIAPGYGRGADQNSQTGTKPSSRRGAVTATGAPVRRSQTEQ